jgi:hypothetical protein
VDGDGQKETGRFVFESVDVEESIRTGYLVNSGLDDALAVLYDLVGDGESKRKGISIDGGGGQHVFELDLMTWTGESNQWGRTDDATVLDETSATGADHLTKMNIFQNYLRVGQTDSFTPGRFQYGQYHPDGLLDDHLEVAIESPTFVNDRENASIVDGSLTVVEIAGLTETLDGQKQRER